VCSLVAFRSAVVSPECKSQVDASPLRSDADALPSSDPRFPSVPADDDATIYGLAVDPNSYPVHPTASGIRLLTAKQYAELAAQDLTRDTPEHEVFPWLHGADRVGSNQAIYFLGSPYRTCPVPRFVVSQTWYLLLPLNACLARFRGLTTLLAPPSLSGSTSFLPHSRLSSFSSLSTSSLSSSSSSAYSLLANSSPSSFSSLPGGPEPRAAVLVSSLNPDDVLSPDDVFVEPALPSSVNLRNFKLQAAKYASISDIVIYSEQGVTPEALQLAQRVRHAQKRIFAQRGGMACDAVEYNVYVIADPFEAFERDPALSHLVAVDSSGFARNRVDFFEREREEMARLTHASPIADGVWLGNDADVPRHPEPDARGRAKNGTGGLAASLDSITELGEMEDGNQLAFSICVEAHDQATMVDEETLQGCDRLLADFEAECEEPPEPQSPTSSESSFYDESDSTDDKQALEFGRPRQSRQRADRRRSVRDAAKAKVQHVLRPHVGDLLHLECLSTSQVFKESPAQLDAFVNSLVSLVRFLARQASPGPGRLQKRVLIYAQDGYTDSSVLAVSYIMYVRQCSLSDAYLFLQNDCGRSFFVYQKDLDLLERVHDRLFEARHRPAAAAARPTAAANADASSFSFFNRPTPGRRPSFFSRSSSTQTAKLTSSAVVNPPTRAEKARRAPWFYDTRFDGHFPSRILEHLYLGNLAHASNAGMLRQLGITHVCSIGESALVPPAASMQRDAAGADGGGGGQTSLWEEERAGRIAVLDLQGISDDGIDPIRPYFERTMEFIDEARLKGGKCLVHCRVGVSRSATLVIAYCMRALAMDLVSAYLLVRSRRLNILIQVRSSSSFFFPDVSFCRCS
jgi:dual specificity MAP kinase phosphatase